MNNTPLDVVRACLRAYVDKDRVWIEALLDDDYHFTSQCEVHTARDGKLVATEVYFGWNLPHGVPRGEHVDR